MVINQQPINTMEMKKPDTAKNGGSTQRESGGGEGLGEHWLSIGHQTPVIQNSGNETAKGPPTTAEGGWKKEPVHPTKRRVRGKVRFAGKKTKDGKNGNAA